MTYFLLSSWNTVLDYDENHAAVFARPINNDFPSIQIYIDGQKATLKKDDVENIDISSKGILVLGPESKIFDIKYTERPGPYISLRFNGFYVSVSSDGSTAVDKARGLNWETFRLVSLDEIRQLSHFLNNSWYLRAHETLISKEEIERKSEFTLGIKNIFDLKIDDIIIFLTESNLKEIKIYYDTWKIEFLDLFRPAVYYCSFGRPEGFDCLGISISSIRKYGKYTGEIKIISEKCIEYIQERIPEDIRYNVESVKYTALDNIDYMSARFDIEALSCIKDHQPVLYIDTDIIIKKPINEILVKILADKKSQIQVFRETSEIMSDIYWGKALFEDDHSPKIPEFGFSTGIMSFRNFMEISIFFESVREIIFRQSTIWGTRQIMRCYDQPVANYILGKFAIIGENILSQNTVNFNMHYNNTNEDEYNYYIDNIESIIVHFAGGVGAYDWKLGAMNKFMSRLESSSTSED